MEFEESTKWKEGNIYSKDKENCYRLKENILERMTDESDLMDRIEINLNEDRPKEWLEMFLIYVE